MSVIGAARTRESGDDSKDEVMHINERSVIFKEEMVGGREIVTTDEERVREEVKERIIRLCEDS